MGVVSLNATESEAFCYIYIHYQRIYFMCKFRQPFGGILSSSLLLFVMIHVRSMSFLCKLFSKAIR